jgi:hypothetical protein
MRFWDASAIVPLLLDEPGTDRARSLVADEAPIVAWWATPVECTSAVARRERTGALTAAEARIALETLDTLGREWVEVPPTGGVRDDARRLVAVHDLRAADALQLAAARAASDGAPESIAFVTLDDRLALAASREGFPVLGL